MRATLIGKDTFFAKGKMSFADLAALDRHHGIVGIQSGKQERLENLVNQYLMEVEKNPLQVQGSSK
jgi:xylose isomerase